MRALSRIVLSLGAAAALCLVAGCSPGNTTTPGVTFTQVKDGSHGDAAPMRPYWKQASNNMVHLYLYGSSSCPPKVEQVKQESSTLRVQLHRYAGACTADYGGPHVWKVEGLQEKTQKIIVSTGSHEEGEVLERRT